MSLVIVGELSADGQRIIVMANGPEHEVAFAARKLELLTPLIKTTNPPGALELLATWPAVVQLSTTFAGAWRPGPRLQEWIANWVRARTAPVPETLQSSEHHGMTPRPYQIEAAQMIASTGRVLLFDEPGTGKTASALLGLHELELRGGGVRPILVVCPASVTDSWVREVNTWTPWRAVAWRGTPTQRGRLVGTADVYVVSYDTARRDAKGTTLKDNPLMRLKARTVVADEFHRMKNHHTAQSKAVRRLAERADRFVGLSGTPITHHPADLWPGLVALSPGAWPSRERWVNRYCVQGMADYGESILGLNPATEKEFRTTLLGQYRRVAKADVLTQLPPKVYSVREVELPAEFRRAYDDFESEMLAELPDDGGELSVMDTLSKINFLSRLACSAGDVEITIETEWDELLGEYVEKSHTHLHMRAPSWKVDALIEILEEREGLQTVTAAPSSQLIRIAGEAATKAGYRVGYVIGGQSPKERTAQVDAFQAGELDLICVTTSAGGVGITLTAASGLVFLQRPYSFVEASQMEDRCHRIGSERHGSIDIIDVIAKNTVDTRIRSVLRERAGQLSDLVRDPRIVAQVLGGASVTKINGRKAS